LEQSTIPPSSFEKTVNDPKWNAMGAEALMKAEAVNDKSKSQIVKAQRLIINYLGMDNQAEIFKDVRVRQAFNYGIDKDQVIKLLNGRGLPARGVLPMGFPGYKDGRPVPYPYDMARAKDLLQQAGWKLEGETLKKDGKPFQITLWYNSGPEYWAKVMASVQADLKKLGIQTEIRVVDWAPYLDKLDRGEAQFFRLGWQADYPDPDNFLWTLLYSKNVKENRAKYRNPQVDKLLDQAQTTMDWTQREALYQKAEDIIVKEAPWVFLYQPVTYEIFQPYVRSQQLHPLIPYVFKIMKLEK
jgi:peptide/nickel transport system substrate-binding protein/oligopeptide transport system substrate-binding protein